MMALLTAPAAATNGNDPIALAMDVFLVPVVDGTARLIDLGGGCFALSQTGTELLRGAMELGVREAPGQVAQRYGIDPVGVRADLAELLTTLRRRRLIDRPGAARRGGRLGALLLATIVAAIHRGPLSRSARAWVLLGLARTAFRWLGWRATVAAFLRFHRDSGASAPDEARVREIDGLVRDAASTFPIAVECKERALACWSLARALGLAARLVVGINTHPLEGHCWCEAGPFLLSDYPDRCQSFVPIVAYD
jgi:hypothetical protein